MSALTKVLIWNGALTALKADLVASESENTPEANVCRERYEEVRHLALERHPWNFASARALLQRLVETPAFGWKYFYATPPNMLRLWKVFDRVTVGLHEPETEYQLEYAPTEKKLAVASNDEQLYCRYVVDVEDVGQMPPTFREYLALELAFDIGLRLTEQTSIVDRVERRRDAAFARASSIDASNNLPVEIPETEWVMARY